MPQNLRLHPSALDGDSIRQRMNRTGIGYAGIEGAWWLPAVEPFGLPTQVKHDLADIGEAIFLLFDSVTTLYGTAEGADCGLNQLLDHKVPPHILCLRSGGRVQSVRPDFQLCLSGDGQGYQLVATELEICPSAQGFAQAMQVGMVCKRIWWRCSPVTWMAARCSLPERSNGANFSSSSCHFVAHWPKSVLRVMSYSMCPSRR